MNSSHLAELEDDIQKQLVRTEGRVREEVSPEEGAAFFFVAFSTPFFVRFFLLRCLRFLFTNGAFVDGDG